MSLDRQALRQHLRAQRKALSEVEQAQAADELLTQFIQAISGSLSEHSNIALYLANDGEISPSKICQWCWANGHHVFLPVLNGQSLVFAQYTDNSEWLDNRFGIAEPIDHAPLSASEMDIVLMPLVGFDKKGDRLGMGGGFYDRTFEHKADKTRLIGLAHDCQEVEELPIASWDVPVHGILTATRFIHCPIDGAL